MKRNSGRCFALLQTLLIAALLQACATPKVVPTDLAQLKTPEELGQAAQRSYQAAKNATEKAEKLKFASAGIAYADKCLQENPRQPQCLYYQVLNTGTYIQNHIPNYQRGLKQMVASCDTLIAVEPGYENGGCYRVLGNIYAQAPSFSLNPKNITQDMDKSVEVLRQAVKVAPQYALNHLFLSRSLEALGQKDEAVQELQEFDRLKDPQLDSEYPQWQKERDQLAQKLHISPSQNPPAGKAKPRPKS